MGASIRSLSPQCRRTIRSRLLRWYDRHQRDLPWRHRQSDGYAQLLAEFMLQQTQVATVIDYYHRFIDRFPTVDALATAELDDVLALWAGLGYYRRARNLHAAARQVVEEFDGRVPSDPALLMRLPGVGRYTAGAIASVAYDTPAPVVDGNVTRVLARLLAIEGDPKSRSVEQALWATAESLLPARRCGDFNQALMELGATVCVPRSPNCLLCPLRTVCRAHQRGLTDRIPVTSRRPIVRVAAMVTAAILCGNRLLLVRRPPDGLWGGLWEPPTEPVADGEELSSARRRLRAWLPKGSRLASRAQSQVTRHLTHRRVTFHVFNGRCPDTAPPPPCVGLAGRQARWAEPHELQGLGISRAGEAVLRQIGWPDALRRDKPGSPPRAP